MGDQLVMLTMIHSQIFHGVILVYLDDALEYQVRAQINLPNGPQGKILAASFIDQETVDVVTRPSDLQMTYKFTRLTLLDQQELYMAKIKNDIVPISEQ